MRPGELRPAGKKMSWKGMPMYVPFIRGGEKGQITATPFRYGAISFSRLAFTNWET